MDALILGFAKDNIVTVMLALAILKVIAKATPWAADDEVVQVLTGVFSRNIKIEKKSVNKKI